jgi:diguanylate cyclase (GGDEF)-like protein/PAS domain S-box-containing protein
MESFDQCVFFKNRNHVLTEANLSTRKAIFGTNTTRNLVGLTDYDLFPEEVADRYYGLEKRLFAGLGSGQELQEFVDQHGKKTWSEIRKYLVKNDSGEIIGLFGMSSDVTHGVLAEQALREIAESLQESQKIAGLGSYVLSIQNQAWTSSDVLNHIFGIDENSDRSVEGWQSLVHPDDLDMMAAYFVEEVVGKRVPFDHEYRIVRQNDRAERWVHGLGRLEFNAQGMPTVMRGTIQDITDRKRTEAALRESQELLQLFIRHAPAALAMLGRDMRYLAVSRRWLEMHSLVGRDIIGQSHYEVFPEVPEAWKAEHCRALAGETVNSDEDRLPRVDGVTQWLRREMRPWLTGSGSIGGIVIFSEDITERKRAEQRLHLAASVFTHASEGIVITDAAGTILDVNESFTRITGYAHAEAVARTPNLLNSGRQSKEFYANMWRELIDIGHWSGEIWNRGKDGRIYPEMLTITAVRDKSGATQQYVALFSDLTSIKERDQQLERIAHFDVLTGLPNRVLLHDRLHQAMAQAHRRGQTLAVVCLDLDDFKSINDRHGHSVGDRMLTTIAHRMEAALHEDDSLARLGGDEFIAVLLDFNSIEDSVPVLNKLLNAAREPVLVDDLVLELSASAGVTYFPQSDEVDADQLLRQAGQAMYQSKLEGKNRYHIFDASLDRTVRGHHEDLERVRLGLISDEFVLYYQPKMNMATGAALGAEALIRWQHPGRGLLPPIEFLPVVEGHPLVVEIGEWVIDNALTQMERWHAEGLDLPVSVNISAQQLQQANFVERLSALLVAHPGIDPSCLEIEVLESSALLDVSQVSQVIHDCGRLGVSFALDDFGTGYSSLSYLKRLPVDVLKIDQTFIRDMLDDPEDLTIVEGILGLASAFRRRAVAEGVESVEHGLLLLRLGCQVAQGYGIARPMPAHELSQWIASWRPDPQWINVSALDPVDRPLLYAGAEHSAWVLAIDAFIRGHRRVPPVLDHSQCRFGAWMNGENMAGRGWLPVFRDIESLHQQLHAAAAQVLEVKAQGRVDEALDRLPDLFALRDGLVAELRDLMQRDQV